MPEAEVVIEVFGEGVADIGKYDSPTQEPKSGILPILVKRMCGKPPRMRVKGTRISHLERGGHERKVKFHKNNACLSGRQAAVYVVDSDGDKSDMERIRLKLAAARDSIHPEFPMAVGVAHPCIESWLLADATAIRRGLELDAAPEVPDCPEDLPAPCRDRLHNPKTELCKAAGVSKQELSAAEKDCIARCINDHGISLLKERCPLSFAPFAEEVEDRIRPLF